MPANSENTPQNSPISGRYLAGWGFGASVACGLIIAMAASAPKSVENDETNQTPVTVGKPIALPSVVTTASINKNDAIENVVEESVTVVPQRKVQARAIKISKSATAAPTQAQRYAVDLGEGASFTELEKRYQRIAELNPALFRKLEARGQFEETSFGLAVHLRAGPFISQKGAASACGFLVLPADVKCKPALFEGNPLRASGLN